MPNLIEQAVGLHEKAVADEKKKQLEDFKKLLKERFQIEADPQETTTNIGGVRIRFVNAGSLAVKRKCPTCEFREWANAVSSIEQLGIEMQRSLAAHDCSKNQPEKKADAARKAS